MKILVRFECKCGELNSTVFNTDKLGKGLGAKIDPEIITHGVCGKCGRLPLGISVVKEGV